MPTAASLHTLQVTWSSYSLERAMEILLQDFTGARMLANCTVTFSFWLQDCTGTDTHTHTHTRARALPKNLRRLFFTTSLTRVTHTTKLHGGGGRGSNHPDYGCFFPPPPKTDYLKYYYTFIIVLHSLWLRTLLLQTPQVTLSSFFYRREGNFHSPQGNFPSSQLATLHTFKSPAGREEVTWPRKWRGNLYSWRNLYLPWAKPDSLTTKDSLSHHSGLGLFSVSLGLKHPTWGQTKYVYLYTYVSSYNALAKS